MLAPIYLASLYTRPDECVANAAWSLGRYDVVSHMDFDYLQMFLWERFRALASNPVGYFAMVHSEIGGMAGPTGMMNVYRARSSPWVGVKQSSGKSSAKVIDKEENPNFKLYAFAPTAIYTHPILYARFEFYFLYIIKNNFKKWKTTTYKKGQENLKKNRKEQKV